jgi:aldehyde dehydrogenase (NAD+)
MSEANSRSPKETVDAMRAFFETNATLDYSFRVKQLKALRASIKKHEGEIFDAFRADYNKREYDTFLTEVLVVYGELDNTIEHLRSWMVPEIKWPGITPMPAIGKIYRDPYGVCLIVAPWNYPFQLLMNPLVGAICGGNCALVKPSANAPHVSAVIKKICDETFDPNYVFCTLGSREQNKDLFDQMFDMCFFTGGTVTGRKLLEKQAQHVTPVVLELGGKSPVIVAADCDVRSAARKLAWGKFCNAGQTCVAPDYVLIERPVHDAFIKEFIEVIRKMYYKNGKLMDGFIHIISDAQFEKVTGLIDENRIVFGGKTDPSRRLIEPTVLDNVQFTDKIMSAEIFGPVMPFVTVDSIDEAIADVRKEGHIYNGYDGAKPLALYCFTSSHATAEKVMKETTSGGACINDTILHAACHHLPFCGVGFSGNGFGYHGKTTFQTFTHNKGCVYSMAPSKAQTLLLPIRFSGEVQDKIVRPLLKFGVDRIAKFAL